VVALAKKHRRERKEEERGRGTVRREWEGGSVLTEAQKERRLYLAR